MRNPGSGFKSHRPDHLHYQRFTHHIRKVTMLGYNNAKDVSYVFMVGKTSE
jgi:hypothetical protein